jgi:hypothetical protein
MLTSSVIPFYDNACPYTAACSWALPEHFNWELFECPSYHPDFALSNYHLFTSLKNWLGSQHFNNNECWWKVSKHDWFHRWQTFWTQVYKNLFPCYDKCHSSGGDCIEN